MTAQERRDCVTAIQIAVRSEDQLLAWGQRLSTEQRRQVLAILIGQANQRAVQMWEDACALVDETNSVKRRD